MDERSFSRRKAGPRNTSIWTSRSIHTSHAASSELRIEARLTANRHNSFAGRWYSFASETNLSKDYCLTFLHDMEDRYERQMRKWFAPAPCKCWSINDSDSKGSASFSPKEQNFIKWFHLSELLPIKEALIGVSYDSALATEDCLQLVSRIVQQMVLLSEDGTLPFLQDIGACLVSRLGLFLHKVGILLGCRCGCCADLL